MFLKLGSMRNFMDGCKPLLPAKPKRFQPRSGQFPKDAPAIHVDPGVEIVLRAPHAGRPNHERYTMGNMPAAKHPTEGDRSRKAFKLRGQQRCRMVDMTGQPRR